MLAQSQVSTLYISSGCTSLRSLKMLSKVFLSESGFPPEYNIVPVSPIIIISEIYKIIRSLNLSAYAKNNLLFNQNIHMLWVLKSTSLLSSQ